MLMSNLSYLVAKILIKSYKDPIHMLPGEVDLEKYHLT